MNRKDMYATEEDAFLKSVLPELQEKSLIDLASSVRKDLAAISEKVGKPIRTTKAIVLRLSKLAGRTATQSRIRSAEEIKPISDTDVCKSIKTLRTVFSYYQNSLKAAKQREKELVTELRKLRSIRQAVENYNK